MTALVCGFGVHEEAGARFSSDDIGAADVVLFPGEGEEMQDAEDGHFNAEKEGRNADFDVRGGDVGGGFDSAGGSEEGESDLDGHERMPGHGMGKLGGTHRLPEGEEDDEFNGDDFDERSVFSEINAELDVELDQADHGDGNTDTFNKHYLRWSV